MGSHFYSQEDQFDSQNTWIDNIDPELRSSSQNQDDSHYSQMEWQRQPQPLERFIARSPGPEAEWYSAQYSPQARARDDYSVPNATSYLGQGFPETWSGTIQSQQFTQPAGYLNLSQVQGIPDTEDTYDADEGYAAIEMKAEYAMQTDGGTIKVDGGYPTDEGLGQSIESGSPRDSSSVRPDIDATSEMDAEGDEDIDPETIVAEAPSDTEYSPRSTRTRKRRPSKSSSFPANKRSRVIKALPKSKGSFSCKSCDHAPFKDTALLQRHIATSHTRAFVCVFAFAGCQSTFASKNEWKRHVSSQHLNLSAWVCELGACGKTGSVAKGSSKGSEFNRKDLFTQHLRRMHAPFAVKRQNKKNAEWEEKLKELQVSCLRVKRHAPASLACPVRDCPTVFEGATCWDDRMEHVGKHLEKAATATGVNKVVVEQGHDDLLVGWALRERIIEARPGGGFRLYLDRGARVSGDDVDADCEDDN
ncbi:hypothetical protein LSUE1_G002828 [Lachnellula suecica]|uniref:C2H2-type domain-containing protein n=1 Tax=Lachnellula suecica TaxID=602035 RepID=A0A8T9CBG0_9HELO|nr:hypothetical protein LSUE1_G002828 [Lachnellula suecica]